MPKPLRPLLPFRGLRSLRWVHTASWPAAAACLLALLVQVPPALGQAPEAAADPDDPGRVVVTGRVIAAPGGQPLAGALVVLGESRTLTDERGRFRFDEVVPGEQALLASYLGYRDTFTLLRVGAEDPTELEVVLEVDPVVLEGLEVVGDRLEARRRATPVSVRVVEREELLHLPYPDMEQLLRVRIGSMMRRCPGDSSQWCIRRRGAWQRLRVYIDSRPAIGGVDELSTLRPHEIHSIEIFGGGQAQVFVYTTWFMQSAARRNWRPRPIQR